MSLFVTSIKANIYCRLIAKKCRENGKKGYTGLPQLSFNEGAEDLRESPTIQIVKEVASFHSWIAVELNIHHFTNSLKKIELLNFDVTKP